MARKKKLPPLPSLLASKIYKTGQTRGADDDVIYQNRVMRASTVLIPYGLWGKFSSPPESEERFENGFIVLIDPSVYFESNDIDAELASKGLRIGENALVFYQKRTDWDQYNPIALGWTAASSRKSPLNGQYTARVAATTAIDGGNRINEGFTTSQLKGAGIRLFEYASKRTITDCRLQLEALYWLCKNSLESVVEYGMILESARLRKDIAMRLAGDNGFLDLKHLQRSRLVNSKGMAICPLCLEELSAADFFSRLEQAEGREVHDLTVTRVNLFHINELRYGEYNHRPYNLGWGHHHCNVVVRDSGIEKTLSWMSQVLKRNEKEGLLSE